MNEIEQTDGGWVATVVTRRRDGSRNVDTSLFGTRSAAEKWAEATEVDAALCRTVASVVLSWHDDRVASLRDTTAARESSLLAKHVCGDPVALVPIDELTRHEAAAFAQRLRQKSNGRGATLSPKTMRHVLKALRHAFSSDIDLETNVFERVVLPSLTDVEMTFLSRSEVDKLLASVDQHRWGWAFGVILLTGLRRSEFCGLNWEHVHLDGRHVDIRSRRTTAAGSVVEGAPKTRKARRRVPLDPFAAGLLAQRIKERDTQRSSWGPDWAPTGDNYVWCLEDGSPPHPDRLTAEFARFCGAIGIADVGLHGLRHTFATVAIAAGMAPYALSRSLGHSTVSFTLDKYGHLWDDGLVAEFEKVGALLGTTRLPSVCIRPEL